MSISSNTVQAERRRRKGNKLRPLRQVEREEERERRKTKTNSFCASSHGSGNGGSGQIQMTSAPKGGAKVS